ncbi:MAG: hypothetical protein Q8L77_05455 [Nitrospirota bacterium]|nr:hypothetical protein [Nitrospirota bacterium]
MNATAELHVEDIKKLLAMLQKLVGSGNLVIVVVKHNLNVIKNGRLDYQPRPGKQLGRRTDRGRRETGAGGEGNRLIYGAILGQGFTVVMQAKVPTIWRDT